MAARSTNTRRWLVAAAALTSVGLVAGCGDPAEQDAVVDADDGTGDAERDEARESGGDDSPAELAPAAALAAAVAQTEEAASTGEFTVTVEMSAPGLDEAAAEAISISGSGTYDLDAGSSRSIITMGAGGEVVETEQLLVDGTLYQRSDVLAGIVGADTEWISSPAPAAEPGSANPMAVGDVLDLLDDVDPDSVTATDGGEVAGAATTRYTATLDSVEALAGGELDADELELFGDLDDLDDLFEITIDVWVDGDDVVRKIDLDYTMDLGAMLGGLADAFDEAFGELGGDLGDDEQAQLDELDELLSEESGLGELSMSMSYELVAVGIPVDHTPPDPSTVTPLDEVVDLQGLLPGFDPFATLDD